MSRSASAGHVRSVRCCTLINWGAGNGMFDSDVRQRGRLCLVRPRAADPFRALSLLPLLARASQEGTQCDVPRCGFSVWFSCLINFVEPL